MKALMVLSTLLLQKISLTSKSKDNIETLKRRLNQCKDGQREKLLVEGKTIQERLFKDNVKNQSSDRKATLFAQFMENRKANKALKLLESSKKGAILSLIEETFEMFLEKHLKASEASSDILIEEEVQNVHCVIYDGIDSKMVRDAIIKTRGFAGPSGLDADGWCRISGEDLRKAIADMTKRLCQDNTVKHLEVFLACRLIPLDKQPGIRPTGIGKVLRPVTGKIVMKLLKKDVLKVTGSLQLCAGQDAGKKRLFMPFMKRSIKKAQRQY